MATKDYDKAVPNDMELTQAKGHNPSDKDRKLLKYM